MRSAILSVKAVAARKGSPLWSPLIGIVTSLGQSKNNSLWRRKWAGVDITKISPSLGFESIDVFKPSIDINTSHIRLYVSNFCKRKGAPKPQTLWHSAVSTHEIWSDLLQSGHHKSVLIGVLYDYDSCQLTTLYAGVWPVFRNNKTTPGSFAWAATGGFIIVPSNNPALSGKTYARNCRRPFRTMTQIVATRAMNCRNAAMLAMAAILSLNSNQRANHSLVALYRRFRLSLESWAAVSERRTALDRCHAAGVRVLARYVGVLVADFANMPASPSNR